MSKHPRKKRNQSHQRTAQQRSYDRGIYAVIIMVGLFGLGLWFLADDQTFPHGVIGYVAVVLGFINWSAIKAWRGSAMSDWQRALARLPLRFAGYGTKGGKPVEAAREQEKVKMVLMISISLSIVILLAVTLLLLR